MSNEKIQDLLSKLRDEIAQTELDDATRARMAAFDDEMHRALDPAEPDDDANSAIATARQLEAEFAAQHPLAEKVLREIVENLSRMGV